MLCCAYPDIFCFVIYAHFFSLPLLFFFNDPATPESYTYCHTLSLHAALPISGIAPIGDHCAEPRAVEAEAAKTMRIHEWPRRPAGPFAPTSLRRPARQGIGGNQDGLLKLSGAPQEHPISKVRQSHHDSDRA